MFDSTESTGALGMAGEPFLMAASHFPSPHTLLFTLDFFITSDRPAHPPEIHHTYSEYTRSSVESRQPKVWETET